MVTNLPKDTLVKFRNWNGLLNVGVIESFEDGKYKIHQKNSKISILFIEPSSILEVIDKDEKLKFTGTEQKTLIEEPAKLEKGDIVEEVEIVEPKVEIEYNKGSFYGLFADGGSAYEMLELDDKPNELTIFIPLTDSNEETKQRTSDVKDFLSHYFGYYLVENVSSSFIDENGELISRKNIQVTSYPTEQDFNDFKHILIHQMSVWAKEWNELARFEYEDETFSIMPTEDMMKKGGELWIQDAMSKMKKKGTLESFTKQAKREGLTPIEFAKKVLSKPKGYTLKTRRRAMFVKNTNPEKF